MRTARARQATAVALLSAGGASDALAHDSALFDGGSGDPLIAVLLVGCAVLYAIGLIRLRRTRLARSWPAAACGAGWLTLAVALLSPLDTLSARLFSMHMTQHMLLMLVAAPLLVMGRPVAVVLWALPRRLRLAAGGWSRTSGVHRLWRTLSTPFTAWLVHGIALWAWHMPVLYEAALRSEALHALQHTTLLLAASVFWWALLYGSHGRTGYGLSVACLFTNAIHTGILGALLTFSGRAWYPTYEKRGLPWGLTALADQQIGGLVMWVPGGVLFTLAGLGLFAAWLREVERRTERGSSAPGPPEVKPTIDKQSPSPVKSARKAR